jgi:hypothetical protein
MNTNRTGLAAFGENTGTLWVDESSQRLPLSKLQKSQRSWRRNLLKRIGSRPLVWFVDDEFANREWFAVRHRPRFAILTFGSRRYAKIALDAGNGEALA